ncbi:hypothetical protein TanjilG_05297 [Lupinus angustifolius]|uniref:RING-type E3 ubiquitin transferase BRCA1 n=1 Tax=Lupinus angustifolius TaxID=3871 RepID=A0A4P1QVJ5_LUPAN|nr:PREDICTED: protein BREAST CANCER SUSCEPTIBILITY 1 homolog [Lupinus angustifolius]OIV95749.1 hypothetical protein TanjilG_05297 [Lupinus angustifolius]
MNDGVCTFHLERMGRELKCPICWSLLNSSVSLTCNHVFCNSCILKSMKLASDCPVCKVPYTRREVRPAPQMDNMVSIYKSMENASGISMFVTQNVPVTKLSDKEKQHEDDDCEMKDLGETHKNHAQKKNSFRKEESKKKIMTSTKGVDIAKPSFPAKKRIQVSQDPLSETPLKNYKFGGPLSEMDKLGTEEGLILANEKDNHALSPFFWLRDEEDGEKISQHSNGDQLIDCATPTPPSFSDLKDSDDESPPKKAPSDVVQKKASVNLPDSEIFEWTQRPLSPELFSSPVKMQVEDTGEIDKNQEDFVASAQELEKNCTIADADNIKFKNSKQINGLDDKLPRIVASQIITSDGQNGIKKSTKRGRKAGGKARQSKTGGQRDPIDGMDVYTYISLEDNQEKTLDHKHNSSNMGKTNRRAKGVSFRTRRNQIPQMACTASNTLVPSNGEVAMANNSSHKEEIEKHTPQEVSGKSMRKRSERPKLDYVQDLAEELSPVQNKTNDFAVSLSSILTPAMEDIGKASRQSIRNSSRKSMSCNRELGSTKKLKLSSDGIIKTKNDVEIQPNASLQQIPVVKTLNDTSKETQCPLTNRPLLQKCESHMKKYQCVFCLSSEESEVSGPIVHYYDGKPVTTDYEGGYKVTHSHKNCTEWAPNVYFVDDNAINLEAEISRSKRIKCCLCGLKGAALGCYEKSCRKSFHVPCAKLTSQCRWDMENFVMLCPLHASSKLPCESSGSQERSNKTTTRESKSPAHKHDTIVESWTTRGTSNKLVLCCSALSVQERGVVSEFEKVSKVTVLKKWDSSVTHVIASTDENGACRRTLKVLLGILEGKWILNIDWIKACMKEMGPVDEGRYEINVDIHGIKDGPRLGRLRVLNKQPKLFNGYTFYFMGHFEPSYKGYLQDLVIAAGGNILHRKPVSADQETMFPDMHLYQTLIIYSLELPGKCSPSKKDKILNQRLCDSEAVASSTGSKVASNTWILNSIAACKLQSPAP